MKQKVKHLILWWSGQASRIARDCLRLVVVSAALKVSCPGETPVPHKSNGWSPDTLFTHIRSVGRNQIICMERYHCLMTGEGNDIQRGSDLPRFPATKKNQIQSPT